MTPFNFHNKTFTLLENSQEGKVTAQTIFEYQQDGNLVTANYYGGSVRYGKIIARLESDKLHMLYQCLTETDELKAGKAIADISLNAAGKIMLQLNWEWLDGKGERGTSLYIEN